MCHHAQHGFILTTFPLFLNSFLLKISIDQSLCSGRVLGCRDEMPWMFLKCFHVGGLCQTGLRVSANKTLFVANVSKLRDLEEVALKPLLIKHPLLSQQNS
jgi:hypothetical protein